LRPPALAAAPTLLGVPALPAALGLAGDRAAADGTTPANEVCWVPELCTSPACASPLARMLESRRCRLARSCCSSADSLARTPEWSPLSLPPALPAVELVPLVPAGTAAAAACLPAPGLVDSTPVTDVACCRGAAPGKPISSLIAAVKGVGGLLLLRLVLPLALVRGTLGCCGAPALGTADMAVEVPVVRALLAAAGVERPEEGSWSC
jgi:hypothetical protein